jgi:hypothetical protein
VETQAIHGRHLENCPHCHPKLTLTIAQQSSVDRPWRTEEERIRPDLLDEEEDFPPSAQLSNDPQEHNEDQFSENDVSFTHEDHEEQQLASDEAIGEEEENANANPTFASEDYSSDA